MKYYIYSNSDGFRREFPHVKNVIFDNEWFYITDEKNIQWEFKKEFHTITFEYEKGDWTWITEMSDIILVKNTIDKLHKRYPNTRYKMPDIKKYNGTNWYTQIYEEDSSSYYILIL